MDFDYITNREKIVEFLVANHEDIKEEVKELRDLKEEWLSREHSIFRKDLEDQYEARIRQLISFAASEATNVPIDETIIIVEKLDIEGYLNV